MKFTSTIFGQASGSLNGTTFSHNRNGQYTRRRAVPVNPNTIKQQQMRGRLTSLSQAWRGLTDSQRAAWVTLANQISLTNSLGLPYTPTGLQLYVGWNSFLLMVGASANNTAPGSPPSIVSALTINATISGTSATFAVGVGGTLNAAERYVVECTAPYSPGKAFIPPQAWRYLAAGTAVGTQQLLSQYVAINGTPSAGSKVAVRLRPYVTAYGMQGANVPATYITA